MKNYQKVLSQVKKLVWLKLKDEEFGHGYWHCYRVVQNCLRIGEKEGASLQVLELAAWLHDIGIGKDKKGHAIKSARLAKRLLSELNVDQEVINQIISCIKKHRFSKRIKPEALEEKILQDADKLDALGAIGIARVFVFSGRHGEKLHDPRIKPDLECFLKHGRSTTAINHFYEKLFKLKGLLHTKTAKKIALEREKYMKNYLKRFYLEWEGDK